MTPDTYSSEAASTDLIDLKNFGITGIRIAMPPFDSVYTYTQESAIEAKRLGYKVYWGVTTGTMNFSEERWQDFLGSIMGHAAFASANGVDCFMIGNEEEMKASFSGSIVVSDLKQKAQEVRSSYPNLTLMVCTDQGNMSNWVGDTDFDLHGYNIYGPGPVNWTNAVNLAASDSRGVITEWNTADGLDDTTMSINGDMTVWASVLETRRNQLNRAGLEHFIFAMRGGGFGIDDRWSMWVDDTKRSAWYKLY